MRQTNRGEVVSWMRCCTTKTFVKFAGLRHGSTSEQMSGGGYHIDQRQATGTSHRSTILFHNKPPANDSTWQTTCEPGAVLSSRRSTVGPSETWEI